MKCVVNVKHHRKCSMELSILLLSVLIFYVAPTSQDSLVVVDCVVQGTPLACNVKVDDEVACVWYEGMSCPDKCAMTLRKLL